MQARSEYAANQKKMAREMESIRKREYDVTTAPGIQVPSNLKDAFDDRTVRL